MSFRKIVLGFCCFVLLLAFGCSDGKNEKISENIRNDSGFVSTKITADSSHASVDTTRANQAYYIDSVYSLNVNGKNYRLVLSQNYPSQKNAGALATTLFIIDTVHADTLYRKMYEFNEVGQLRNPAPGHYWIALLNSGGGSGYSATLFNIRIENKIEIQPLFDFNELSYWKTNPSADEVLFFDGFWDMSSEDEYHFSPHKQFVSQYTIKNDTVISKEIGTSAYKYDLFDNADSDLEKFQKQEKKLNKIISWNDFR